MLFLPILNWKKAKNTRKRARRFFNVFKTISSRECIRNAFPIKPNWYETRSNTPYVFNVKSRFGGINWNWLKIHFVKLYCSLIQKQTLSGLGWFLCEDRFSGSGTVIHDFVAVLKLYFLSGKYNNKKINSLIFHPLQGACQNFKFVFNRTIAGKDYIMFMLRILCRSKEFDLHTEDFLSSS